MEEAEEERVMEQLVQLSAMRQINQLGTHHSLEQAAEEAGEV